MPENKKQQQLTFLVDEDGDGERLDKFLAAELSEDFSRERIQALVEAAVVTVNGKTDSKVSRRLKEGDVLVVTLPEAQPLDLAAEDLGLDVLYEDEQLLVVNKPAGMLTHPTGRESTGTLVNGLLFHCRENLSGINGVLRPGIVHRLDRDTSGLLMVAKTDRAHRHLSEQLKSKTARRDYFAIVQGVFPESRGTVSAPIGRNPKHRDKMCVIEDGRPAVTHWEVTETIHHKFSLVRLSLETGRTHQIRVHMAYIGHPVLGDPLYGSGIEKILKLKTDGQLLQAFRLGFVHPATDEPVSFEIPVDARLNEVKELLERL